MSLKKKAAEKVLSVAANMAKRACGAASMFGFYQPKEPKFPKSMKFGK